MALVPPLLSSFLCPFSLSPFLLSPVVDTLGTIVSNIGATSPAPLLHSVESQSVFHLVKPEAAEGIENGHVPGKEKKILTEVFLTRLLSTKVIWS